MLEIRLKPSRLALLAGVMLALLALLAVIALSWPLPATLALLSVLSLFFYHYARRDIFLASAASDTGLRLYQGRLRRLSGQGWQSDAALQAITQPLSCLIIFDVEGQRPLLLWRDAVDAHQWRQLQVYARFGAANSDL